MSKSNMTQIETISVLLNGGHIVCRESSFSGNCSYRVYLPGGNNPDIYVGRATFSTVYLLMRLGFLEASSKFRTDKSNDIFRVFRYSKPSLPSFFTDFCEVSCDE